MRVEADGLGVTTRVIPGIYAKVKLRDHCVEAAVAQFSSDETLPTVLTVEVTKPGIELEEDLSPGDVLLLAKVHDELVYVP